MMIMVNIIVSSERDGDGCPPLRKKVFRMAVSPPAGVSEGALSSAIDAFASALGSERVLTSDEDLRDFRDPFQPPSWDTYTPSVVVLPETVEEVQAVVRAAAKHRVPLWAHSTGKNNGYGGAGTRVQGAVTVSLRRMNKVLEINEDLAYAEVEPGVTWRDLYEEITRRGLRLMGSNTDLGWGSAIGNTLENGFSYGVNGSDQSLACGMEVVTADGEVLRTGMGAMDGNRAWHTYKRSYGPTLDQLFMQSNFGIVTKMGVWLLPAPEIYMPVWVRVWKEEDLVPLVDTLRRLRLARAIEAGPVIYNTLIYASAFGRREEFFNDDGPIPEATIDEIARRIESGRWLLRAGLFGNETVVDAQFSIIKQAFERIPDADVWGTKHAFDDIPKLQHPGELVTGGVPNIEANHITGWYSGNDGAHIAFSPVVPADGKELFALHQVLRRTLEQDAGLDYMVGSTSVNARSLIHVGLIVFDGADEAVARSAYDTAKRMVGKAREQGYGEFRAHLDAMDEVAEHYDFNNHAYLRFVERIKDAVDPVGILSPGKQGIWPRHLRQPTNGRPS
jgi:4-cresol dehydrogenase (hydroxylating)